MSPPTRQRLLELVPPPPPLEPVAVDWDAARGALGVAFPAGYRWLAETYGPGLFDEWLKLHVPGAAGFDLIALAQRHTAMTRAWLESPQPPRFPYPLHPEPGGLIAWAQTYGGHNLAWVTDGPPDQWPVVVQDFEDLNTERYDGPAEQLLLELLEGTLESRLLPLDLYRPPHSFTPESEALDTGSTETIGSRTRAGLRHAIALTDAVRRRLTPGR